MMREHDAHDPELDALLRRLDHVPPDIRVESLIARAQRRHVRPWRRAAGILLAFGAAGIAYALPGSPLPAWIDAIAPGSDVTPTMQKQPPPLQDAITDAAGVAVEADGMLVIELHGSTRGALVRVSITDTSHVTARGPVGSARFRSEPNRLVIDVLAADTLHITIPSHAQRVEIRAGARRVFAKDGANVSAAAAPVARNIWLLPME